LSELTILTIGVFVVLFAAVIAWSPLARGMIRESVRHPNEPCTLSQTSGRHVTVIHGSLPQKPPDVGAEEQGPKQVGAGPYFKFAMAATFIITLLCLIALVTLALVHSSDQVKEASGTCEKAFIFGFSALIGLIGGKALN
jgi:hypothetical protein